MPKLGLSQTKKKRANFDGEVMTVLFKKSEWSGEEGPKKWLRQHKWFPKQTSHTKNFYRFIIHRMTRGYKYYTHTFSGSKDIKAVIKGWKFGKRKKKGGTKKKKAGSKKKRRKGTKKKKAGSKKK